MVGPPDHVVRRARRRPACSRGRGGDAGSPISRPTSCGMEAERGLVQHVERVDQAGAQRLGQDDTLELAPGEPPGRSVEGQVIQPDLARGSRGGSRPGQDGGRGHRLAAERASPAMKGRASRIVKADSSAMSRPAILTASASGRSRAPWQPGRSGSAAIGRGIRRTATYRTCAPALGKSLQSGEAAPGHALESRWTCSARAGEGDVDRNVAADRNFQQAPGESPDMPGVAQGAIAPDGSSSRVGDDSGQVELHRLAEPFADGAGPQGAVESEEVRLGLEGIGPASAASPAAHVGPGRSPAMIRQRPSPLTNADSIESMRRCGGSLPRTSRSTITSTAPAVGRTRLGVIEADRLPGRRRFA